MVVLDRSLGDPVHHFACNCAKSHRGFLYADAYGHTYIYTDGNAHSHPHGYTDGYADSYSDAHTHHHAYT